MGKQLRLNSEQKERVGKSLYFYFQGEPGPSPWDYPDVIKDILQENGVHRIYFTSDGKEISRSVSGASKVDLVVYAVELFDQYKRKLEENEKENLLNEAHEVLRNKRLGLENSVGEQLDLFDGTFWDLRWYS